MIQYKTEFFTLAKHKGFTLWANEDCATLHDWLQQIGEAGFKIHRVQPTTWNEDKTTITELMFIAIKEVANE